MNRSALKTYAPKARLEFIRAVTDRAAFFGLTPQHTEPMQETGDVVIIGGRAFPKVVAQQRRSLEARVQRQGFDQVMEAMAYTWFNRFVALRYMELHGYLEHGYRVLSHPEGKPTPEIVEHAEHVTLPGLDAQQVINLKLDGSREAELYRLLIVAQCNALNEAMPFLFEKIADETELLLPDNLLHSDSLIRKLANEIEETDWQQVEIIGWLYQFYISDKKEEVIGKVVKSEDIPAATQLFTPNWIVKYLVQNTIGRQWLATYPDSPLRQQMQYYIEPAEQTDEVKAQLAAITPTSLDPETLTLLDPASGSGHILVEAYDLFKAIYQERGYRSKDIPRLILEKNLFGLEIDDRAAQLAAFALLMKARADDRRIFTDHVQPNVIAIQESKGLEHLLRPDPAAVKGAGELPLADSDLFPQTEKQLTLTKPNQESPLAAVEPCLRKLIKLFEHGKTFGSLIRVPAELTAQLPAARQSIEAMVTKGQLWEHRAATFLLPLVKQAELLAETYNAVVTNPPYMGARNGMNAMLKNFVEQAFPMSKADLFAVFIERGLDFTNEGGNVAMITMESWMFLPSFDELRPFILRTTPIVSMLHLGPRAFDTISGEIVRTTAFSLLKHTLHGTNGVYHRLIRGKSELEKQTLFLEGRHRYEFPVGKFRRIPEQRLAYWLTDSVLRCFDQGFNLETVSPVRQGFQTGNNDYFMRYWHEVDWLKLKVDASCKEEVFSNNKKWIPYNKGGDFRKWFGNNEYVVAFDKQHYEMLLTSGNCLPSRHLYFREAVTWSAMGSIFGARLSPKGFVFSAKGACSFPESTTPEIVMCLLNSKVAYAMFEFLAPTMDFNVGSIRQIPIVETSKEAKEQISATGRQLIDIAKHDWDSFECSWDFQASPIYLATPKSDTTEASSKVWTAIAGDRIKRTAELETKNNSLLLELYGLTQELSSEVPDSQITLTRSDQEQNIQHLISYALGCMMGRYSLDKPGLVYAHSRNEGFDASQYQTFPADADGIIPITELAWFPDDATERFVEFIGKAWPAEHLEENLKFIADSLGANRDEHPRDTIRRYLGQNFYKDHLQTYKRRPIYWLFSSGKQKAFSCLVYLHRYHEGTLARMRTEYVIPLQGKLAHRVDQLAGDIAAATSTSHRRKLEKERDTLVKQRTELVAFDEKLRHYADQRIALDLDDGVKVNYGKFGDLLAEVKAVTGGAEE